MGADGEQSALFPRRGPGGRRLWAFSHRSPRVGREWCGRREGGESGGGEGRGVEGECERMLTSTHHSGRQNGCGVLNPGQVSRDMGIRSSCCAGPTLYPQLRIDHGGGDRPDKRQSARG